MKESKNQWWSRTPAMAAFSRYEGRNKKTGRLQWVLSHGELRYIVALGSFADGAGLCNTPQKTIAKRLNVSRTMAARWEKGLCDKGFAESTKKSLKGKRGQYTCRVVKLLYPANLARADGSMAPVSEPPRTLPRQKRKTHAGGALMRNASSERPEVTTVAENDRGNVIRLAGR